MKIGCPVSGCGNIREFKGMVKGRRKYRARCEYHRSLKPPEKPALKPRCCYGQNLHNLAERELAIRDHIARVSIENEGESDGGVKRRDKTELL